MGKLVWHIGIKKDDMWVLWVHNVYIKQQNWWEFQAPSNASWIMKYMCKVKEELKSVGIQTWDTSTRYKIKEVYNLLLPNSPKVNWAKAVWNRMSLLKHRFILWLSCNTPIILSF